MGRRVREGTDRGGVDKDGSDEYQDHQQDGSYDVPLVELPDDVLERLQR